MTTPDYNKFYIPFTCSYFLSINVFFEGGIFILDHVTQEYDFNFLEILKSCYENL